jgi:hypothetical protein
VQISALLAPLLPVELRYDDRVRAGLIYLVDKMEAIAPTPRQRRVRR